MASELPSATVPAPAAEREAAGGVRGGQSLGAAAAGGLLDEEVAAGGDGAVEDGLRQEVELADAEWYCTDQPDTVMSAEVGLYSSMKSFL